MRHIFQITCLSVAALLTGCASVAEGTSQEVTLLTPGVTNAECYVNNNTIVTRVRTGDTFRINKNYDPMEITCRAPGNREVTATVHSELDRMTRYNLLNGFIPGLVYDLSSKSAYRYPDTVVVNFKDLKPTEYPLPEHALGDAVSSDDVELEEILPGQPKLASDKGRVKKQARKIDPSERASNNPFVASSASTSASSDAPTAAPIPLNQ